MNNIRSDCTDEQIGKWFESLGIERMLKWKKDYEKQISIVIGLYDPGVYTIMDKVPQIKLGQRKEYPEQMTWMLPAWEKGLKILNSIIDKHMSKSENTPKNSPEEVRKNELEKIKSHSLKRAEAIIKSSQEVAKSIEAIIIKDEQTLSMATQTLSKGATLLKQAEEARMTIQRPYMDATEMIRDTIKEAITIPLEKALVSGKEKLRDWNIAQKKLEDEEKVKNQKKYDFLTTMKNQIDEKIKFCVTPEKCQAMIKSIENNWPATYDFGIYTDEAAKAKEDYIVLLKTRGEAFAGSMNSNANASEVADNMQKATEKASEIANQNTVLAEKKEIANSSISTTKSATRKTWKFEVVEETKLVREFLSADEKKIRDYMSKNKEKLKDGQVLGGVKFYIDEVPVIS